MAKMTLRKEGMRTVIPLLGLLPLSPQEEEKQPDLALRSHPYPSSPLPAQDEPLRARGTSLGLAALQPQAVLTEGLRATVRGCV